MLHDTDIAWLAGIIDGEGCFSVKRPVARGKSGRTAHQVWLVLCNTSRVMVERAADVIAATGAQRPAIRRVWKGVRATRWQYWINIARKADILRVTEAILPHLTAKRIEAAAIVWFLKRACRKRRYQRTTLDVVVLEALSVIKRNGGEAPTEIADILREVIPSEILQGPAKAGGRRRRVEATSLSPNDKSSHERPATVQTVDEMVQSSNESRSVGFNGRRVTYAN